MKYFFLLLFCCAGFLPVTAQVDHQSPADKLKPTTLSIADWQSDLRFLQQTVHKDYSFLFKKVTAKDFDAEVEKLYNEMPSMKDHERLAGIARIVALFKYGHTDIGWRQSPLKYHVAPVNFYWFSDGVYAEGADKEYAAVVGARLVKVEGVPVLKALESLKPLVPVENEQYFKGYGMDFLLIPEALHAQGVTKELKKTVTYTFEKNGTNFDQTITGREVFRLPRTYGFVSKGSGWVMARDTATTPHYLKNLDKIYYYEYLPASKTVYIRHSQIQDDQQEAIPAFYRRVFEFIEKNDVERLVLDLRLNGGGNNYKNKPIVTGIIRSSKINVPGKLFVIIGRRTFSACQNLVNELSNYTNALFVGEPTAENINFYGDNRRVDLPQTGIPVYLSYAWWQDKPQWENRDWLGPHLSVEMSFEDFRQNRDPVLEACLDFSEKDPVLDPMARLKSLFEAGKMDEVEAEAMRFSTDPKYRYVNFEEQINSGGYDLLGKNRITEALFVFGLNTRLFPRSANAWDSFAEATWKAGQKEKAVDYYKKAIELDPDGNTGSNAKSMLAKLQAEMKK